EPHNIRTRPGNAVVILAGIHDSFGDAESCSRREAPEEGTPPALMGPDAIEPQQGQRLADFFAEANSQGEAHEAQKEAILWIEGGPVGEAYQLDEVENQDEDAPPRDPDPLRPARDELE